MDRVADAVLSQRLRPIRVFVSYTAELASYPPVHSFVDAACAGIRRVDAVAVTMIDFGARHDIPLEVCRSEVLSCDVHLSLIGFRYGSLIPERAEGISYTEFEFEVATVAGLPRLVFLIDDHTPMPPALVDHDRALISRFRRRVREGADHLAIAFVSDPGRLEAAVSQALVRIGQTDEATNTRPPTVGTQTMSTTRGELPEENLDLDAIVTLLAAHFQVDATVVDRRHAAGILRGIEGSEYSNTAYLKSVLALTTDRRQKYFGSGPGVPDASEHLAVALAIIEPSYRVASWAWGWDSRSLELLEQLAGQEG